MLIFLAFREITSPWRHTRAVKRSSAASYQSIDRKRRCDDEYVPCFYPTGTARKGHIHSTPRDNKAPAWHPLSNLGQLRQNVLYVSDCLYAYI